MTQEQEQEVNRSIDRIIKDACRNIKWNSNEETYIHQLAVISLDDERGDLHLVMSSLLNSLFEELRTNNKFRYLLVGDQ